MDGILQPFMIWRTVVVWLKLVMLMVATYNLFVAADASCLLLHLLPIPAPGQPPTPENLLQLHCFI